MKKKLIIAIIMYVSGFVLSELSSIISIWSIRLSVKILASVIVTISLIMITNVAIELSDKKRDTSSSCPPKKRKLRGNHFTNKQSQEDDLLS